MRTVTINIPYTALSNRSPIMNLTAKPQMEGTHYQAGTVMTRMTNKALPISTVTTGIPTRTMVKDQIWPTRARVTGRIITETPTIPAGNPK